MKTPFLTALLFTLLMTVGYAAVTAPQMGVVRVNATGDVITNTYIPVGSKITSVKVNGATASKVYRLRYGNYLAAPIIYESNSAATTGTMVSDPVSFRMGSSLYYQTDDASTNANLTIYTD